MIIENEGPLLLTFHWVNLGTNVCILGFLGKIAGPFLREYKIYNRMKERLNSIWFDRCQEKHERFEALENGK